MQDGGPQGPVLGTQSSELIFVREEKEPQEFHGVSVCVQKQKEIFLKVFSTHSRFCSHGEVLSAEHQPT